MLADPLEDIARRIINLESKLESWKTEKIKYARLNLSGIITLTSNQNNWDIEDRDVIFATVSTPITINGIANGKPGRMLYVRTAGNSMAYTHQNASATPSNRIVTSTFGTITIPSGHWAIFVYGDAAIGAGSDRWFMVSPDA